MSQGKKFSTTFTENLFVSVVLDRIMKKIAEVDSDKFFKKVSMTCVHTKEYLLSITKCLPVFHEQWD